MTTKTCQRCEATKDLEAFGQDKRTPDGRAHTCAECKTAARAPKGKHGKARTLGDVVKKHTRKAKPDPSMAITSSRSVTAENDGDGNIALGLTLDGEVTQFWITHAEAAKLRDWLDAQGLS